MTKKKLFHRLILPEVMRITEEIYGIKHITDNQRLLILETANTIFHLFHKNITVKELKKKVEDRYGN